MLRSHVIANRSWALLALLAIIAVPHATADKLECPSFVDLGHRLDAKVAEVLALKPGLPLKSFQGHYAYQALNFWTKVGAARETVFFVVVEEGNAYISDEVSCRFGRDDRLQACRRECCRSSVRTISKAQYDGVAAGDVRERLERSLCGPSNAEGDAKNPRRTTLYYHVDLPIGHHDEGQTAMLVFEDNKLVSKDMSPYY
jgi:hypothetical protein